MKILILEDNEVVKDVLFFLLKDDFDIKIIEKELEAIEELRRNKFNIFLIGSKIMLNFSDTVRLFSRLSGENLNPDMKIIAMVNGKKGVIKQSLLDAGVDVVVERIPLRNVIEAVKKIAARIETSV